MTDLISIEKHLKYLEKLLLQPRIRHSAGDLNALIADEFIEFGSSGKVYNKKDIIKLPGNEVTRKMTLTNFKLVQLGKNYFLTTYKILKHDKGRKIYTLRSSIWKKEKSSYRIIFHQGTIIK